MTPWGLNLLFLSWHLILTSCLGVIAAITEMLGQKKRLNLKIRGYFATSLLCVDSHYKRDHIKRIITVNSLNSIHFRVFLTGVGPVGDQQHPQWAQVDVPLVSVGHQSPVHVPGLHTSHFTCTQNKDESKDFSVCHLQLYIVLLKDQFDSGISSFKLVAVSVFVQLPLYWQTFWIQDRGLTFIRAYGILITCIMFMTFWKINTDGQPGEYREECVTLICKT